MQLAFRIWTYICVTAVYLWPGHDHYEPYIARVVAGEQNVMFPSAPRMVGETSGTSGRKKLVPVSWQQRKVFFTHGIMPIFDAMATSAALPSFPSLQKTCKLVYTPSFSTSEGGLKVGSHSRKRKHERSWGEG